MTDSPFPRIVDSKQRTFLAAFRETGNVRLACEVAKVGRSSHYRWLEMHPAYREAFDLAKLQAAEILEQEAYRRAVEGTEEPIGWYRGVASGTVRRYSDVLLMFLLKGLLPERYRERVDLRASLAHIDLKQLPDELLARIAAGEHPFSVLAPGQSLATDPDALRALERHWFQRAGRMPAANAVQAQHPPGARLLPNPRGTAPGIAASFDGCRIYVMPGPPREMRKMFRDHILPDLETGSGVVRLISLVHQLGLGESVAEERLGDITDRDQRPRVGITHSAATVTAGTSQVALHVATFGAEPHAHEDSAFGAGKGTRRIVAVVEFQAKGVEQTLHRVRPQVDRGRRLAVELGADDDPVAHDNLVDAAVHAERQVIARDAASPPTLGSGLKPRSREPSHWLADQENGNDRRHHERRAGQR